MVDAAIEVKEKDKSISYSGSNLFNNLAIDVISMIFLFQVVYLLPTEIIL